MDRESSTVSNYNHSISLLERKTLVITGVKKIENFDNLHFLLETTMGFMIVKGEGLELIKLDTLAGNVTIKGTINIYPAIKFIVKNNKIHLKFKLQQYEFWEYTNIEIKELKNIYKNEIAENNIEHILKEEEN